MTWEDLRRNADGEITRILLTLREADGSNKVSSLSYDEDENSPIDDIYIGRYNGELRVTSTP